MRIDAHQHFWRIDRYDTSWMVGGFEPLRRDYLPEHLEPCLRTSGVDKSVFVQAQHSFADNFWVLELAARHDFIAGVVAWIDPTAEHFEARLEELQVHSRFCGVRHLIHNEPDQDFILRDDVQRNLAVLEKHRVPFDLLFFVEHLRHAKTLAERFPGLPMVIDHLAKPRIKDGATAGWIDALRAAAAHPNIYCKLSGLVTEADWQGWKPEDLRPYVDTALELFGPERCMFGSDWPVCEVAATYAQVHDALAELVGPLSEAETAAVFGGTAARFYGL